MKQTIAKKVREDIIAKLLAQFSETEDCGMVASNSFNFPIVQDGEEGWVEIVVKVPKYSDDEGFELRNDYSYHVAEMEKKAKEKEQSKKLKAQKDKAKREQKARERAKREGEE